MNQTVKTADISTQYDERAKSLLANKIILAHILVKTVDEFRGMKPEEIVHYIEGEPLVGIVPVGPGVTNAPKEKDGRKITGLNTESAENNEGLIRFDIIFYVRMKDGLSQMIINLEAQKDEPTSYPILNRAVFYVSRLISSQKGRDFEGTNYTNIKRVFSIWICMNMKENTMNYVHLTEEKVLGDYPWKGKLNLLNIVLIGISNTLQEREESKELHHLLSALFSNQLSENEKFGIMEKEYHITVDSKMREDVSTMCNLSQGILEQGEAIGEARGIAKERAGIILNMHKNGYTIEQIASATDKNIEEVRKIIENKAAVLV